MTALILAFGFAVVLLLVAVAAWLLVQCYSLCQDCRIAEVSHAANHAYVIELRRRQFASMDKTDAPDRSLTVLHFPHPPGAA